MAQRSVLWPCSGHERAKDWAERAVLLDPDNMNMRYNLRAR
jgi:hypothetical protein